MTIEQKLIDIFTKNNIEYHDFDRKSADRSFGGKSILFKDKTDFRIFTIRADLEVDNKKVRKILGSKKLRFASHEELQELCGVVSGALPPIIRDLYPYDHFLDKSLLDNEWIAFNLGVLDKPVKIKMKDYLKLVDPTICEFAKE